MVKSIYILIPSFIISFFLGLIKGIYDFKMGDRRFRFFGEKITSLFLSVPDFFVIICIQIGIMALIDLGFPHINLYGSETFTNKLFAILFLSIYPTFYVARITEMYLSTESGKDYVRTAIGKGTPNKKVIYVHMLSNCWVRVVGQINTLMLYILSNLFIVEFLTGYRGGAYRFYQAFNVQKNFGVGSDMEIDIPVVIEYVILFTTFVLLTKIVSDIVRSLLLAREASLEK
ncbi:ABC transporter permease subunit [Heyndrickxia sp. NPDC080065]|uniref:ABC transporter permease subunit n=1 Tax=Heyndrickxia sp. NPDC080065 TaxID=3390568 RepID=UPI003D05A468